MLGHSLQESIGIDRPVSQARIILPLMHSLTPALPSRRQDLVDSDEEYTGFGKDSVRMVRFETTVEVMSSKEKPKKLTVLGSDGVKYNFLCKQERKGDLRKDARLMETNALVNRSAV